MIDSQLTAGELSKKALSDPTKYNALEVGHAMTEDIDKHLRDCIEIYRNMIDEKEFCVVMLIGEDPLIKNVKRRKFYAWPFLPKPRPNQAVFLYNKGLDRITKRLWVLPSAMVMAELTTLTVVDKRYETMQAWAMAFYKGTFWEFIRWQHKIDMPSEHEYALAHRNELIEAGCKLPGPSDTDPFDFSKIAIKKVIDPVKSALNQNSFGGLGEAKNPDRSIANH